MCVTSKHFFILLFVICFLLLGSLSKSDYQKLDLEEGVFASLHVIVSMLSPQCYLFIIIIFSNVPNPNDIESFSCFFA